MKHSAVLLALGIATATIAADAVKPQLAVMRLADRPTIEGPAANFTGKARIDRQVRPEDSRQLGSMVSFEPGARTAWHTHPLGQTLVVISGWRRYLDSRTRSIGTARSRARPWLTTPSSSR
jgi:hypothetical protein